VLSTAQAPHEVARRLIDFACEYKKAIGGQVQRIDAETFRITPTHPCRQRDGESAERAV